MIGAEAIQKLLSEINLEEQKIVREELESTLLKQKKKLVKRLKFVEAFHQF